VDGVVFYTDSQSWPQRLFQMFSNPDSASRYDAALAANYNIAFLFASGPFRLDVGQTERFSLALAYGQDLNALRRTTKTVQQIYNGNYQFAVAPTRPIVTAEADDHLVRLTWDDAAERSVDPVTNQFDFEGYKIYRSTDPDFLDSRVVTDANGAPTGNGQPIAQFDLANGVTGYFPTVIENLPSYFLGSDTGVRHTFEDPTVTNGQTYYYAVCAYDHGSQQPLFYPSENNYSISRTIRGGVLFPTNVVQVAEPARHRVRARAGQHAAARGRPGLRDGGPQGGQLDAGPERPSFPHHVHERRPGFGAREPLLARRQHQRPDVVHDRRRFRGERLRPRRRRHPAGRVLARTDPGGRGELGLRRRLAHERAPARELRDRWPPRRAQAARLSGEPGHPLRVDGGGHRRVHLHHPALQARQVPGLRGDGHG